VKENRLWTNIFSKIDQKIRGFLSSGKPVLNTVQLNGLWISSLLKCKCGKKFEHAKHCTIFEQQPRKT